MGERPPLYDDHPSAPKDCPDPWGKLIQACWQKDAAIRPTFVQIKEALQQMKTQKMEWGREPPSYEQLLIQLGIPDKKDVLQDCGLDEGLELKQLGQMDPDDLEEEIIADEDLALDEETKDLFRDAVRRLSTVRAVASKWSERAENSAETREASSTTRQDTNARNSEWSELCEMLCMHDEVYTEAGKSEDMRLLRLRSNLGPEDMQMVESLLAEKDDEAEELRKQLGQTRPVEEVTPDISSLTTCTTCANSDDDLARSQQSSIAETGDVEDKVCHAVDGAQAKDDLLRQKDQQVGELQSQLNVSALYAADLHTTTGETQTHQMSQTSNLNGLLAELPHDKLEIILRAAANGVPQEELLALWICLIS
jgi:hypothetical protein